ncbi:MAG: serine/threonine-protein phosphatase [Planctomycetes bacterium]|nr:serine/threonine-protein phosphatase [Planctomycetota bacterium]
MTEPGLAVTEPTLWFVGPEGLVLERHGTPAGPDVGDAFDGACVAVAGRVVVESPVRPGGSRCVAVVDPGAGPDARALLARIAEFRDRNERLEDELQSMSETAVAVLESTSLWGDLSRRLGSCAEDRQAFEVAAISLAVAAKFARVAVVRFDSGREVAELLADVEFRAERMGHVVLPQPDEPVRFDATRGALGRLLEAPALSSLPMRARDLPQPIPSRSPEARARDDVLVVAIRFAVEGEERLLGALICVDRVADDYRVGEPFNQIDSELADNVAALVAFRVGSSALAAYRRELTLANEIQSQILPERAPAVAGFDLAGRCRTSGDVGGDYLDYLAMADGRTLALVADVSGHNLASGMIMVGARSAMRVLAARHSDPGAVFSGLLDTMFADLQRTERFVTAGALALRPGDGAVDIVNCGHNPTLVYRARTGAVESIGGDDPILGFLPGVRYGTRTVHLDVGDVALLYTDGVIEASRADGEMFGEDRLVATLTAASTGTASDVLDAVYGAVEMFSVGDSLGDDVTVVAVKRVPPGGEPCAERGRP